MAFSPTYDLTSPGAAVSNREDLKDNLSMLEPQMFPITSALNKGTAKNMYVETTMDTLDSVSTDGVAEGSDVSVFSDKFANRARIGNYCQIFRKDGQVSRQQNSSDSVGPANVAKAQVKTQIELKRNIEATLASTNDRQQGNGAGRVYKLRGLGDWIDSAGPSDVPADYRTPSGAIETDASANFTETAFLGYITSLFRVSGEVNNLICVADTTLRRAISDFHRLGDQTATIRNVNYTGGSADITLSVERYQSDHGIIDIVNGNPDCMPTTTASGWAGYLLNLDYAQLDEFLPMSMVDLPDFGGGPRWYVDCTLTLSMLHPGAHGKITD